MGRGGNTWRDRGRCLKQLNQPDTTNALQFQNCRTFSECLMHFFFFLNRHRRKKHHPQDGYSIWVGFYSEYKTQSQMANCKATPGWLERRPWLVSPAAPSPGQAAARADSAGVSVSSAGRRVSRLLSQTVFKLVATHNMIYSLFLMSLLRLSICISAGDF